MNSNTSFRRLAILLTILSIVSGGMYAAWSYMQSFQYLTVKQEPASTTGTTISIIQENSKEVVASSISPGETIKIKKGSYRVRFTGNSYREEVIEVTLDSKPETITITPSYTSKKLSETLHSERSAIREAIDKKFPGATQSYTIEPGKLYMLGEWYGTKLYVKQSPEQARTNYVDIFRLVLKKEGSTWRVITDPPQLILSSVVHPEIPREVLVDVNKNPEPST